MLKTQIFHDQEITKTRIHRVWSDAITINYGNRYFQLKEKHNKNYRNESEQIFTKEYFGTD